MKKFIFGSMLLGGLMMASCSDDVLETPEVETTQKTYAQKFQEMIGGPVSRTQDFSTIQSYDLNVTLASAGDIKIYARVRSEVVYQLVAHYENQAAGAHSLKFDGPENLDNFIVQVGNDVRHTSGEAVSFTAPVSRTYVNLNVDEVYTTFEADGARIQKEFTLDEVEAFDKLLPAGENCVEKINNGDNPDGISIDFSVINIDLTKSEQSDEIEAPIIRIYPVYWIASYRHIFGIFTYDDNGGIDQHYDIYKSRDPEEQDLMVWYQGSTEWENAINNEAGKGIYSYRLTESQGAEISLKPGDDRIPEKILSHGFEVKLPATKVKRYGFYLKVFTNGNFNSNPTYTWYSDKSFNVENGEEEYHAAYFQAPVTETSTADGTVKTYTRTFLGFEDNTGSSCDWDLNDFMFIIEPEPTIVDHSPLSWKLAAEDLGSTDDFDFNDVVVLVDKLAGQEKMNIKALAAGGTLPVYLMFDDQYVGPGGLSTTPIEFHSWFEGNNNQGSNGDYPMINTGRSGHKKGATAELTLDENFLLSYFAAASDNNVAGFKIVVGKEDGTTTTELTKPQWGAAPQMMCLPIAWRWPVERASMVQAYKDFGEWGCNYQAKAPEWVFFNYDKDLLYKPEF